MNILMLVCCVGASFANNYTPTLVCNDQTTALLWSATDDVPEKVKAWVDSKLKPFMKGEKKLVDELQAANAARAGWADYSEDYKGWTPEEAEKHKPGYAYCEYLWSVKKDKAFRSQHTTTPEVAALKQFQDGTGGVVSEFFCVDAKGGNVCQTQLTSDWFQGDEPKFKDCAKDGGVVAYGKMNRDDTTGETGVHVSIPVFDSNNKFIGAAIVLVIVDKIK